MSIACTNSREAPKLTGLSPSSIGKEQLPAPAVLSGSGLQGNWRLALDSRQAVTRPTVTILLNESPLTGEVQVVANELHFTLPNDLDANTYDLQVQFGAANPVTLFNALTIEEPAGPSNPGGPNPLSTPGDAGVPDAATIDPPMTAEPAPESTADSGVVTAEDAGGISEQDAGVIPPTVPVCLPGQFGDPELVTINGVEPGDYWSPSLSADHRTLYFGGPGTTGEAIWQATRTDRGLVFSNATRLPSLQDGASQGTPWIAADDLNLYFYSNPASGSGERDLFVSTRVDAASPFGRGQALTNLNGGSRDQLPWLSPDALTIAFYSRRGGGIGNVWTATRAEVSANFNAPVELSELNSSSDDGRLFISTNGLVAYFSSSRSGGLGGDDIWYAQRATPQGAFADIQSLTSVNSDDNESDVTLTSDGLEMFFASDAAGSTQFYRATAQCDDP